MFKKNTGKSISIPAGIGLGILLSVGITVAGAALIAYLLNTDKIALSSVGWGAIMILAVASFAGSILAAQLANENRLPVSLGVGLGFVLTLLGCTALFFGGQYQGIVATVLTVLMGSTCAGIIGKKRDKTGFRRKKLHSYR